MWLANSSFKISKKDDFVCILDSTKYLIELVEETVIFWITGHSWALAAIWVQYQLSTNRNLCMISLSLINLESSDIYDNFWLQKPHQIYFSLLKFSRSIMEIKSDNSKVSSYFFLVYYFWIAILLLDSGNI